MSRNDEIIIITAARPGLWMRERFAPSAIKRWLGETFYKDYGKSMEKLRQIDDAIYEWVKDIEQLNKELKERRKMPGPMTDSRVVDIARILGAINRRFKKINRAGDILEEMNEEYLEQFENQFKMEVPEGGQFHEPSEDEMEDVERLRQPAADDAMYAEAGFWDDLKDKWISRKRETNKSKERRKAINDISGKADALVRNLKKTLKNLSKARSSGDVGVYLDTLNTISEEQQKFENSFVEVYNTYVKEHVDKMVAEQEAPDTIADPQTGDAVAPTEPPETIEEEIVEDLGGELEPGEAPPADQEEWMASQIMEDDLREFVSAPTQRPVTPTMPMESAPEGMPPTIPQAPLLPSFDEPVPSTQPGSIDVELPPSWDRPESSATEWQPPAERHVVPQSKQPKTKRQKQTGERPKRKTAPPWEPPAFRDIFVQEDTPPTEPSPESPAALEQVSFEGVTPEDLEVDEISSGMGTARNTPAQVQIAKAISDFFKKTATLSPSERAKAMLAASETFESIDPEISAEFLSIAETILEDAE
jgi:hypothetical protein